MIRSRGFTLIELLVVIVIIATLAGMATLSLGGSSSRNWTGEVQRLANLLQLVADRALIDKAHYGVVMESDSYRVVRFDPSEMDWSDIQFYGAGAKTNTGSKSSKDKSQRFAGHQLPGNMRLEVLSEAQLPGDGPGDAPAEFTTEQKKQKEENKAMPQFVALSSGEVLPVELALYLLRDGEISRGAFVSYSSLSGLQLRWQEDE